MDLDTLMDHYYEEAMEGVGVVAFIDRAVGGRYGALEPPLLHRFLDRLEIIILGNIETKLEEAPGSDDDAERAARETRLELAEARARIPTG